MKTKNLPLRLSAAGLGVGAIAFTTAGLYFLALLSLIAGVFLLVVLKDK